MKNKILIILILLVIVGIGSVSLCLRTISGLKADKSRLQDNQETLNDLLAGKEKIYRDNDSLWRYKSGILRMTADELKQTNSDLARQLEKSKIKIRDLESASSVSTETRIDTFVKYIPVVIQDSVKNILKYKDQWTEITVTPTLLGGRIEYCNRDSLDIFTIEKYAHKFLWFRWGKKLHSVEAVSHNPRTKISGLKVIKKIE